jgi:hypothetical protein
VLSTRTEGGAALTLTLPRQAASTGS